MRVKVNRRLLTQTGWDSGSLTPLASVLHRFREVGTYSGAVLRGGETVGLFDLVVDEAATATQVNIDLEALQQRGFGRAGGREVFVVHPKQPTQFYVPHGRGGYAVVVHGVEGKGDTVVFDSRELQEGDVFTLTLTRPGMYSMVNRRAKTKVVVQKRKGRSIPTEPVVVACSPKGFDSAEIEVGYSQPIFCVIRGPSRIIVQQEQYSEGCARR